VALPDYRVNSYPSFPFKKYIRTDDHANFLLPGLEQVLDFVMHSRPVDHPCPSSFKNNGGLTTLAQPLEAAYLDIRRNTSYGFQPTAMVHSLPHVASIWASFLFTIQGFWSTLGDLPVILLLHATIPIAIVLAIACYGILGSPSPTRKTLQKCFVAGILSLSGFPHSIEYKQNKQKTRRWYW